MNNADIRKAVADMLHATGYEGRGVVMQCAACGGEMAPWQVVRASPAIVAHQRKVDDGPPLFVGVSVLFFDADCPGLDDAPIGELLYKRLSEGIAHATDLVITQGADLGG